MASLQVLVGQCGTQLGSEFLHDAAKEAAANADNPSFQHSVSNKFFRPSETNSMSPSSAHLPVARTVLIDMEPKAIDLCAERAEKEGLFRFSPRTAVVKDEGSANNWAFGFHAQGPSRRAEIVEGIRQESECADSVASIHVTHSAAGGTGSGVGSYVSQVIKDEFPGSLLLHNLVWPFTQGEMTTQWFNATHVVQQLHEHADAVHFLSNDEALGTPEVGERPKLEEINFSMSSILTSLHLPALVAEVPPPQQQQIQKRSKLLQDGRTVTESSTYSPQSYSTATSFDVVEALTVNPRRKFFEGFCSPKPRLIQSGAGGVTLAHTTATSWQSVIQEPLRLALGKQRCDLLSHTTLMVLRGSRALEEGALEVQGALRSLFNGPEHQLLAGATSNPKLLHGLQTNSVASFRGLSHHAAVFATRRKLGSTFHHCAERCEAMAKAGAFVHHYSRYGAELCDFEEAVLTVYSIAESYQRKPV